MIIVQSNRGSTRSIPEHRIRSITRVGQRYEVDLIDGDFLEVVDEPMRQVVLPPGRFELWSAPMGEWTRRPVKHLTGHVGVISGGVEYPLASDGVLVDLDSGLAYCESLDDGWTTDLVDACRQYWTATGRNAGLFCEADVLKLVPPVIAGDYQNGRAIPTEEPTSARRAA